MAELDKLKKQIEEQKGKKSHEAAKEEKLDSRQVDKIVERMKKKYTDQGVESGPVGGKLGELRGIITESQKFKIDVESVEDLQEFRSPIIKRLGKLYVWLKPVLDVIIELLKRFPITSETRYYLYSANMRFSITQWLALSASAMVLAMVFMGVVLGALSIYFDITQTYTILLTLITGIFVMVIMFSFGEKIKLLSRCYSHYN